MKAWSIDKKLFAGFGSVVITAMAMGVIALWAASTLNRHVDQLAGVSGPALQLADDIRFLVTDLKARERLVVIATAKQDKDVMAAETAQITTNYGRLQSLVEELRRSASLVHVRNDADAISEAMTAWADQWAKTEQFAVAFAALDAADSTDAGRRFSDKAEQLASEIGATETHQFVEDRSSASTIYAMVRGAMTAALLVTLAIGVFVGFIVRRISATLVRSAAQLRSGSELVLNAAAQVASSAQTLSHGVHQEAASLEETSASMDESSSMTKQNAEHAQNAARLMAVAEGAVGNARHLLDEMVTSMANIKEGSRKVSAIIKTIDEIAFQTNILALNAAVEAARAGDAGAGFAVVAEEVRSLAQRSAKAAKGTAELIEEAMARADRGVARVEKVSVSMGEITGTVGKLKGLIDQVSEASRQQAQGFSLVSQAITEMEQMTQSNALAAQASSLAGEALTTQARASLVTVAQLEALVGTTTSSYGEMVRGVRRTPRPTLKTPLLRWGASA